jgi:hypothetical protein
VDDSRRLAIRKNAGPLAIHLVEALDRIILFAEARAAIGVFRDGNRGRMAKLRELVREIMDVNRAVGAEIVIENEEDVAHADRRL